MKNESAPEIETQSPEPDTAKKKAVMIGFSRPKNNIFPFYSWLIRIAQGTSYSHVYVEWMSDSLGLGIVYEARLAGVRLVGSKLFNHDLEVTDMFSTPISQEGKVQLLRYAVEHAGLKYGVLQALGMMFKEILRRFGIRMRLNFLSEGKDKQICSELVGQVLNDVLGAEISGNLDLAGPKEIFVHLEKMVADGQATQLIKDTKPLTSS